jgi:thiamine pyrophosphokinase
LCRIDFFGISWYNIPKKEEKFMHAVIICGGRITDYDYIKAQIMQFGADFTICADSGYNHAVKLGLEPDVVVGDFDSAGNIPSEVKKIRFPAEKNHTDSEIALAHAREAGAKTLLFIGAAGSRADHTLNNIFLLKRCLAHGEDAQIIDEHNKIRLTQTSLEIKGEKGTIVSLIPLCDCTGVYTEGLKYPLVNDLLKFGEGRGVSNVMTAETAKVTIEGGLMLVIEARD